MLCLGIFYHILLATSFYKIRSILLSSELLQKTRKRSNGHSFLIKEIMELQFILNLMM